MKKIVSPSKRWPGYIGIPSEFYYPDFIKFQDMLYDTGTLDRQTGSRVNGIILQYLFSIVEEWGIEGMEQDYEKFPSKPIDEVTEFIHWWFKEVEAEITGAEPKNE